MAAAGCPRASVDPTAAVGVHSDVTDDVGGTSLYGGDGGTQRVDPLDINQHGLGKPRERALSFCTIRHRPPRNIRKGGTLVLHTETTLILHTSAETSTGSGNPDRGNSHPTQLDRNQQGTPKREISSYTHGQKQSRGTQKELPSYTTRQETP